MPRQAGRVYEHEREQAIRRNADVSYGVQIGMRAALNITRRARAAAVRAFLEGQDPATAFTRKMEELQELLVQAMLYGRLKGMERTVKQAPPKAEVTLVAASPAYARGVKFLARRLAYTEAEMVAMEAQMDAHVARVLKTTNLANQKKLQETVLHIHREGLHKRAGIKELRKSFQALGITETNRFQVEAIMRTQTQLAYAAGRDNLLADPDIDEILWGYKYVTAGDDRVRDTHAALDGTTLPKGDPFWLNNKTPNGWACRCQIIELFEPRKVVEPPDAIEKDGKWIPAGADPGFAFDPGRLFAAVA